MNAYEETLKGVQWVLDNCTSYQVAKDLNISNRTINRYQNDTTPIESMTTKTLGTLYKYYLKEVKRMKVKDKKSLRDFEFGDEILSHAGWSGGDDLTKNIYRQFYVDSKKHANHYHVFWDLSNFFDMENANEFEWGSPQSVVKKEKDSNTLNYFSSDKFTPLNKKVDFSGMKLTVINRPVRFAPTGDEMIYYAGAVDENGEVYQAFWNIFNIVDPCRIELSVDNSRLCKHCLKLWSLNERKCVNAAGHEYVMNK